MTPQEAVMLSGYVEQLCPQQRFNEYTGDAWADLMPDIRYVDALEAVKALGAKQVFIAVAEIIAEVKRIRSKRIAEFGPMPPPPAEELDPDNWKAFIEWQKTTEKAIADGDLKPKELDLPERPMKQLENTFQRIPRRRQYTEQETTK
jgi:hypothetical protein